MSFEEIAEKLGITKRRAEQIYYAAIKKLSKIIDKQILLDLIELEK